MPGTKAPLVKHDRVNVLLFYLILNSLKIRLKQQKHMQNEETIANKENSGKCQEGGGTACLRRQRNEG
jgi:hypothetical protein